MKNKKYKRCKKCKELVLDAENCENCANKSENYFRRTILDGKRAFLSLDMQEGNWNE